MYVYLSVQIQGNAEFAAGEPSTGDVISHLSKPVLLNRSILDSPGTAYNVLATFLCPHLQYYSAG